MIIFFFFNDTATTEIYTLSLHDALPISLLMSITYSPQIVGSLYVNAIDSHPYFMANCGTSSGGMCCERTWSARDLDRKSTRLNSSHSQISYAVFCLKKKNDS